MPLYLPDDDIAVQKKFTKAAPRKTVGSTYTPRFRSTYTQPKPPPPKYTVAEVNDTPESIAERLGVNSWELPTTDFKAGAAYTAPLSQDIASVQQKLTDTYTPPPPRKPAVPQPQEEPTEPTSLLPQGATEQGLRAFGEDRLEEYVLDLYLAEQATGKFKDTADPYGITGSDAAVYFPDGWNDIWLDWFLVETEENNHYWPAIYSLNTKIEDYYYQQDLAAQAERLGQRSTGDADTDRLLAESITPEAYAEAGANIRTMESITGVDYLDLDNPGFGPGGIPMTAFYGIDEETGEWNRLSEEAVFDELYEFNDINPDDPQAVKDFWNFARDELMHAGVFFEAVEWPTGYGGGYGGGYNYPSYGSRGGYSPSRDYRSYLQLTSWSI